jgi:4'-phosphopantetheinyl transferase
MDTLAWLSRCDADVPGADAWLGPRERDVLDGLTIAPRRASWRLGRWTAKSAVGLWLRVRPADVEILAADDGAPEAWVGGERAAISLSLSHRAGRGLAVVGPPAWAIGCDLEVVEPRSDAFVREWLAEPERAFVAAGDAAQRANLVWTGKEAAAKVRREGLRLDVRRTVVSPHDGGADWSALEVAAETGLVLRGWWRSEPGWVMAIASDPDAGPPRALEQMSA